MNHNDHVDKSGIVIRKEVNSLKKEIVRKSIHLASAFVPFLLEHFRLIVLWGLAGVLVVYCIAEFLRIKGKHIIFLSLLTEAASRKRDENKFVLGPVTLALGVLTSAILFDEITASIAIYALAFGDGLASLAGMLFGKNKIPFGKGKTFEGSITCYCAIFVSTFCVTKNALFSLLVAFVGAVIEALPIKDFDNVIIPIGIGFFVQLLLPHIVLM